MTTVTVLLIIVILLQMVILSAIYTSRNVQVKTTETLAGGIDWVDAGLANTLENYRKYGE
ncbi:MAG: hypothetical protein KUG78_15285 [Kangiellaceae bacterium]|nr:hypothetical protein [Kangiellaceae bacterium]